MHDILNNIKGIIFDRDNTLLYFDQGKIASLQQKFNELVPDLDFYDLMDYWEKREGELPRTIAQEEAFWEGFWLEEVPTKFGLDPKETARLLSLKPFYYSVYSAFSDTLPVLESLSKKGLTLAVLTNFELPNVAASLSESGIDPEHFTKISAGNENPAAVAEAVPTSTIQTGPLLFNKTMTGFAKPDPRAYQFVLEKMQLSAAEVLFVDDEPANTAAAEKLGMGTFQIVPEAGSNNLSRLLKLVEKN